jgi:glycosyltransferase involved in cell wall biosynthesis
MVAVHQFAPRVARGDAVGNHVLALRRLFRALGHTSEAYAVETPERDVLPYRRLFRAVAPGDLLLLHYSIGSEVFARLAALEVRRVLVYHNITPAEYFAGINPHAAAFAERGRRELGLLAGHVELAIGVSEFNRADLERSGFFPTAVAPVLIDWSTYDVAPDPAVRALFGGAGPLLLFVGRIAPNKRQDDLIRMLAYYRRCLDPEARLLLVGGYADQPAYYERLTALAAALGLADAVRFSGRVDMRALVACYGLASCFVSLSEHEGFGVPLLEAMRFRVPLVAYPAAALAETLDGAGVALASRDLAEAAEACALLVEREELRARAVAAGVRRLEDFSWGRVSARWREALAV